MAKDETKGTPGMNPNGTPKDDSKGTPKDKGKLYTAAEITKLKSDSASMAGARAEKVAKQEKEALTSELQSTKSRLDALEVQERESRLAEARGDAGKMRSFQSEEAVAADRRKNEEDRKDLVRREGLLKAAQEEAATKEGAFSVAYIAAKHGLEVERLEKLGITDLEILEKVAEEMKPAESKGEDADTKAYQALKTDAEKEAFVKAHPDFDKEAAEALVLDSGEGSGSGERTEQEKLDERYPTMAKNK